MHIKKSGSPFHCHIGVCVCACVCTLNTHFNPSAYQTLHRTHCRNNLRLNENKCPSSFSIIKYITSLSLFLSPSECDGSSGMLCSLLGLHQSALTRLVGSECVLVFYLQQFASSEISQRGGRVGEVI